MKRHPLDPISLLFGLAFSAIGLVFLSSTDPWDWFFDSVRFNWLLPLVVLAGGAALLVSALRPAATSITDSPLTAEREESHDELADAETDEDTEAE